MTAPRPSTASASSSFRRESPRGSRRKIRSARSTVTPSRVRITICSSRKEIEDWVLEKQLKTVDGVVDVSGFGGLTKEYHVDVDPQKLVHYGIPLSGLIAALANSNINVGGNYLRVGEQSFDVRGIGFIHSLDDIRNVVLSAHNSTPIKVVDIARVDIGYAPRLGIVGMNEPRRCRHRHRADAQVWQHA